MGLFSFVGKAIKGVGKVIGGVARVGLGVASKLGVGGPLVGFANTLLNAKRPMSTTPLKLGGALGTSVRILRGNATQSGFSGAYPYPTPPAVLRMSPVLPGGAIATRNGPVAASGGAPPTSFGGSKPKRRRSSSASKKRSRSSSRKRSSGKRRSGGRKLKFGSKAYRQKYLGHR